MKKIISLIVLSIFFMFSNNIPTQAQQSADENVAIENVEKAKGELKNRGDENATIVKGENAKVEVELKNRDEINGISRKLGAKAKKYSKDLSNDKVIGTINGEEILYKEFALKKLMCEVGNVNNSV